MVYFGLLNREYFILNFRNGLKCKLRTKSTDIHTFANVWLTREYESVGFNIDEEVCPEMELLNRACLDLVVQIEELKRENAGLKKLVKEGNDSKGKSELSCKTK